MNLSRRSFLGLVGSTAVAAGTAGALTVRAAEASPDVTSAIDFHGRHQAGITTPAQDRLHFAAFDITTTSRDELIALLRTWTEAAARMCAGLDVSETGASGGRLSSPPDDTGEAVGLPPAGLTLTIGFGPTMFIANGVDRFALASRQPALLRELPAFPGDALEEARSGGDLAVQACSNDPQVAVHAIRNLARLGRGAVAVRWSQLGFGRTSSTSEAQATPRNLFGFKDGTANLKAEESDTGEHLWVHPHDSRHAGEHWMTGGSYLVARRIRMLIEGWDRTSLGEQEAIVGRTKANGAPIGAAEEFDTPDFSALDSQGNSAIPLDSHVRLAHPSSNGGAKLLRRGYSFVDGSDGLGRLDAGLFFLAFCRNPEKQFLPVQTALARKDAMNEYIRHTGSAIFACPPGVRPGGYWGEGCFQ